MKSLILAGTLLITSFPVHSQGLLESIANLAEPYKSGLRRVIANFSGSSRFGGIQKRLSREDCLEILHDDREKRDERKLHNVIYFLGEGYSEDNLFLPYENAPNCKSNDRFADFKLGLTSSDRMRPNSYDPSAVIAEDRCVDYLELQKVEVVEFALNGKKRKCRRMLLSLEKEKFYSYFCVGDNRAYVDYHGLPVKVLEEVPLKD